MPLIRFPGRRSHSAGMMIPVPAPDAPTDAVTLGGSEANYLSLVANTTDGSIARQVSSSITLNTTFNSGSSIIANVNASSKVVIQSNGTLATVLANKVALEWDAAANKAGILAEPAGTNLFPRSQEFDSSPIWIVSTGTVTANQTTAPDSTSTADLLENASSGIGTVVAAPTLSGSGTYTMSVYAKTSGAGQWLMFEMNDNGGTNRTRAWFDVLNGVLGSTANNGSGYTATSSTIKALASGWYRCIFTAAITDAGGNNRHSFNLVGADGTINNITPVTGIYLFGAQQENSPCATSYIVTAGVTVTRAGDQITVSTANFPWSDISGTVYVDFKPRQTANNCVTWAGFKDANNRMMNFNNTDPIMFNLIAGSPDVISDLGTIVANTRAQVSIAFAANDFDGSADGGGVVSDAAAALTTGYTSLTLGWDGSSSQVNGLIYRLLYVPYQRQTVNGDLATWRNNF